MTTATRRDQFIEHLQHIYPERYQGILEYQRLPLPTTFRVNTLTASSAEVLQQLETEGILVEVGPLPNSFIVKHEEQVSLSHSKVFQSGEVYMQNLSSMLPPLVLDPQPREYILDLTAAPGSKTTQLAALVNNEAAIIAIEKNPARFNMLKENLAKYKVTNVRALVSDGFRLDTKMPEFREAFDKILLDAPCSSESYINPSEPKSLQLWSLHKVRTMAKLQQGLLISAARMLKPGGELVYSTCTFSVEENELVVDWLLKKVRTISVEAISLPITNINEGFTQWQGKDLHEDLAKTVRILPNGLFPGFYVAKLYKKKEF